MSYYYRGWDPYVPVGVRKARAARKVDSLKKKGRKINPIAISGRKIAKTFWGEAWCDNLESYSDYANRLPRGRTYARNGSVVDLQIEPGRITAMVAGRELYSIDITIKPVEKKLWKRLAAQCAGKIDSVVELLQGKISRGVMDILARPGNGLFPRPSEMSFECSCPDWADMCKHVSASLYGVGSRLDEEPELLFQLRKVDHMDLLSSVGKGEALGAVGDTVKSKVLDASNLSDVFDIDLEDSAAPRPESVKKDRRQKSRPASRKERKKRPRRSSRRGKVTATARISVRKGSRLTFQQLSEFGIPRSTYQNWPGLGVLLSTKERGVYRATAKTRKWIERARSRSTRR